MAEHSKKFFKKTLSAQMAEYLEESINNGDWQIGEKMPSEPELSEAYGVSRNTLREALHSLAISGLVEVRPGDGTYVKNRSALDATMQKRLEKEDLKNIFEVRGMIEPELCAMAAVRRTAEEIDELAKLHTRLIESYQNRQTDYLECDANFHTQVSKMCHNPLLSDLYNSIMLWYPLMMKEGFLSFVENDEVDIYLHKKLFNYIEAGDSEGARKITRRMIENERIDLEEVKKL